MNKTLIAQGKTDCQFCDIRSHSVFHALHQEGIDLFKRTKQCLCVRSGQLIFHEGGCPSGLYIVFSGKVKIAKSGEDGREKIVRFARKGDVIGYRSLLSGDRYSCSAYAIDQVSLCFIAQDLLKTLISQNPDLAFRLMKLLADDLKKAEESSTHLAQKQVRERVAEALVILRDTYGFEQDGHTLNIQLTREELAGMAGTARETASRFLSEFNNEGIIELRGKTIKIHDMGKITHIARIWA